QINTILLDKTGTITRGKPEVTDIIPADAGHSPDNLLRLAALAEQGSEHPLGQAIVQAARERALNLSASVTETRAIPGQGLQATVAGQPVLIGTRVLLRENGIAVDALEAQIAELEAQGKTVMLVASAGEAIGALAVADTIKPTSARAIQQLQRLGLEVWMLTGDNRRTAEAMARQVGIAPERVLAQVLPADKARQVELLQKSGKVVAMVGDGINDAPALTQADAGIAMGTGADIAIEAADIALVKGNLESVATAILLSKRMMRIIKQNLAWAFGYNIVLIPLAILSPLLAVVTIYAPVLAAGAMAGSSVTVVLNALRLRRF
ncbi:MAG TPA: HAD-IC family P-type ATPase, partial [Ktedonobacterales bacterium]|nr:HAD-IC family P-type ATPase [Ktedonobacterales bacterium]